MISKIRFTSLILLLIGFKYAIAAGDLFPENLSAAPNVHPQQQLKNNQLKSAYPKKVRKSLQKDKNAFSPFAVKQIQIVAGSIEDKKPDLNEFIGKEVSTEDLEKIIKIVRQYYVKQDYLLPQVSLDSKLFHKGIIKINICFLKISNVVVLGEGNHNKLMHQYIENIKSQNPAKSSYTEKMLGLMNKIPGFNIEYEINPIKASTQEGITEAELILITSKKKASVFAGMNNFSPNDLGKYQFSLLNEIYTPFSDSDSLMLQGATTNYPDRLYDFGIGYGKILNSYGTSANIIASHAKDDSNSNNSNILPNSRSDLIKGAIIQQILLDENQDLEVELGAKHMSSTQYQNNGNGLSQKSNVSKYTTGILDARYLLTDRFGGNNFINANYTQGLSGKEEDFVDNDPLPKKHFKKTSLSYIRDQKLISSFSAYLHTAMSHSNDVLPNPEKSIIGGNAFGRGYAFATLQGTKMKAAALELRYTKTNPFEHLNQIQPYLFMDYSHVNISQSNTNISNLRSYGGGLRFRFTGKIDLGMEIAQPCKRKFMADGENIKANTKFNIFINKVFEF